jgi:hypothetical protein
MKNVTTPQGSEEKGEEYIALITCYGRHPPFAWADQLAARRSALVSLSLEGENSSERGYCLSLEYKANQGSRQPTLTQFCRRSLYGLLFLSIPRSDVQS